MALRRWIAQAPPVRGGQIAGDQLRQQRNLFIVAATLVSRAAIRGGMREDDAFSLSDAYIRRVELLTGYDRIINLQYSMVLEFTEQVELLHRGRHAGKLSLDVANYVRHHLSEPISVERMAEAFFLSRPHLVQEPGVVVVGVGQKDVFDFTGGDAVLLQPPHEPRKRAVVAGVDQYVPGLR